MKEESSLGVEFGKLDLEIRTRIILASALEPLTKEQVTSILSLGNDGNEIERMMSVLSNHEVDVGKYQIVGEEKEKLGKQYNLLMGDEVIANYYLKLAGL